MVGLTSHTVGWQHPGRLKLGAEWCQPKVQRSRAWCCATFGSGTRIPAPPEEEACSGYSPAERYSSAGPFYPLLNNRTVNCATEPYKGRIIFISCADGDRGCYVGGWTEGRRCTEGGPTWRITVTRQRLCHARDRADRYVMKTVGGSAVLHQRGKSQRIVRTGSEARDLPWRDAGRPVMNSTAPRWHR